MQRAHDRTGTARAYLKDNTKLFKGHTARSIYDFVKFLNLYQFLDL